MIKNLKINDGKATALISLSPSDMQPYDIPILLMMNQEIYKKKAKFIQFLMG